MRVCGDVAVTEFAEPTITVRAKGVAEDVWLTARESPVGEVWKDRATVWGSSRTVVDALAPPLSMAVRVSSRYEGYS